MLKLRLFPINYFQHVNARMYDANDECGRECRANLKWFGGNTERIKNTVSLNSRIKLNALE